MKAFLGDGDRSWMDRAACGSHPEPDLWYPDTSAPTSPQAIRAGRICAQCPVRAECFAFGAHEPHGIYGGYMKIGKRAVRIPVEPALQPRRIGVSLVGDSPAGPPIVSPADRPSAPRAAVERRVQAEPVPAAVPKPSLVVVPEVAEVPSEPDVSCFDVVGRFRRLLTRWIA